MSEHPVDRFRLQVLGTPDLRGPDGRRIGSILSQPKRLGLLTYLALAPAPVPRASVVATFWPEADEARGRNALSQALFHLRRALGEHVVESSEGDRLWVSPERLWCDARELLARSGVRADFIADVGAEARGELLEGWSVDEPTVQKWLDEQRARVRERLKWIARERRVEPPTTGARVPPAALAHRAGVPVAPDSARRLPTSLSRLALAGTSLALVTAAAVVLAAGRLGGRPSSDELAVLLPRLTVMPGAVEVTAQAVLDEVVAHLPAREQLRIVPAPSASSVSEFRTQLAAIGASLEERPDWILEVSVRVTDGEVAVVGLLYRSPELDVPGRESFSVTYDAADRALLEVPREIARGVAAMVERALGAG
jgi:hypothetical protein